MGLYHKINTISTTYTNYNIENVSFSAFNDFVSENGNPLFIGSDDNIYELNNNQFILQGAKPNDLTSSTKSSYKQFGNCILNVIRTTGPIKYTATYSLDYGKNWNTFEFNSSFLPENLYYYGTHDFGFAYLNNSIGVYAYVREYNGSGYVGYGYMFAYTSDFQNVNIGFVGTRDYNNGMELVKLNNETIAIREGGINLTYLYTFNDFDNYATREFAVGKITYLADNVIMTTNNFSSSVTNPPLYIYKYNNGTLTRYGTFTNSVDSGDTFIGWLYYNNYIYKFAYNQVNETTNNLKVYKINIFDTTDIEVLNENTPYFYWKTLSIVNNFAIIGIGHSPIGLIELDNLSFFLFNKFESTGSLTELIVQDKTNHFYLYTPSYYTQTISRTVTPQERTIIYRNDYSTITGSQVLENAVRSVNHKVNIITNDDNAELGSTNITFTISQNPTYYSGRSDSYRQERTEYYFISGSAKIITTLPIIDNINNYNIKINYNNIAYKYNTYVVPDSDAETIYNAMRALDPSDYTSSNPFPLNPEDYNISAEDNYEDFSQNSKFDDYSNTITNIVKVNDYTITFNYSIMCKGIYWFNSHYDSRSVTVYKYTAKGIGFSLSGPGIKTANKDFIYSIDLDTNNEPIQNNPLTRSENELFSLTDLFFENQANAIIQANKDGRMVLTVNSTSDLNLYLGKELQVELKDGTLANNGATFEVVGIKEKFTGINWKQTYTLKEKKSST